MFESVCLVFFKLVIAEPFACQAWGETWSMPLVVVSTDDIKGTVEKELAESERVLKAAKKQKRGQQPAPAEPPQAGASAMVILEDDDVFSIPSEDEVIHSTNGSAPKAPKKKEKDDAAIQARKEARERAGLWKKEIQKASGLMAMINRCCTALETTSVKVTKHPGVVRDDLVDALQEAKQTNFSFKQSCLSMLKRKNHYTRSYLLYHISWIAVLMK